MLVKSNMFWTIYKKLEKEVVELSYFIHFSDEQRNDKGSQIWTYSNQIADLLVSICVQIEAIFLELNKNEFKFTTDKVGTVISEIDNKLGLSAKQVRIISKNMYFNDVNGLGNNFAPMAYKQGDENDYYSAYCAAKHNRLNALHKANINVLIRALAALFVLNVYYSFENIEIDEISEFDFTLGSDIFMVKYSIDIGAPSDILIVVEDKEYMKKINAYADSIPDSDSEFLKFRDENEAPSRYGIKINR